MLKTLLAYRLTYIPCMCTCGVFFFLERRDILCNTINDGFEDICDSIHNRHERIADGAEEGADLSSFRPVSSNV